ncbi:MAG: restriction endonuclease subunit S [Crocinitomicaceae bacterium]
MEYPKDWLKGELGDFLDSIVGGGTPSRDVKEYWNGSIPWCTVKDFSKPNRFGTEEYITDKGLKSSATNIIRSGILITPTRMALGRAIIYNVDVAINQDLKALYPKTELDTIFLYYWFERNKSFIDSLGNGSTVKGITLSELRSLSFILPPLPEQQKIAAILSKWDELIEHQTQLIAAKEKQKTSLMQKLLSGEVRFPGFEGEWEEVTLGEIAEFRRGSFPQPYGLPEWYDDENGMPFVQVYDVDENMLLKPNTKRKISELGAEQSVFVKKGTLVITIQGSIGRVAKTQYDAYVDRTLLIFKSYKTKINVDYFKYVLLLLFEIEKMKAPGGTIKTITKEVLTQFNVVIPKIEEQNKIASTFSSIDMELQSLKDELEAIKLQKKGLMQQLLTGRIRVNV